MYVPMLIQYAFYRIEDEMRRTQSKDSPHCRAMILPRIFLET